ncbi:hypothetical protein FQN50_004532 [Emmonsiellopsis sp. PD_5]|nr:hypothetical protein FQN50_004532 [Emmonsiellopsis sp. PD_5]
MSKIVAVIGATGGQGGSVADALLADGTFQVRAVVRDPSSEKAKVLSNRGVEVVKANLDDKDSLIAAFESGFKGAYAIFAVTNFFEPFVKYGPAAAEKQDFQQAKNMADAAAATDGLSHYIWSTLPSSKAISNGKFHVPHFEGKAAADEYIVSNLPALAAKTTFFWVSFYGGNLAYPTFTPNFVKSSGKYVWVQPTSESMPLSTIGDHTKNIGIFAEAVLKQPERTRGKYVLVESETTTLGGYLERWSKYSGKEVAYVPTTLGAYDSLFPSWGLELGVMLQFWESAGSKSWSKAGVTPLRKEDLGIDQSRFTTIEDAFRTLDLGI